MLGQVGARHRWPPGAKAVSPQIISLFSRAALVERNTSNIATPIGAVHSKVMVFLFPSAPSDKLSLCSRCVLGVTNLKFLPC